MTSDASGASPIARGQNPIESFIDVTTRCLASNEFIKIVLSKYSGADTELLRVEARRLLVRNQERLSLVYRHKTRDVTSNVSIDDGLARIRELIGASFLHAHLLTTTREFRLSIDKKGKAALRSGTVAPRKAPSLEHDRAKRRFIEVDRPFLLELGITNEQGRIVPSMSRKWKQVNRFIEVFEHAVESSGLRERAGAIDVVDFGCGKGCLTFAVHDYLRTRLAVDARVTGVELRDELVQLCNRAAGKLQIEGLRFVQGDIRGFDPDASIAIMIALHACDTATDYAIHRGIRSGAAIIMCSPCCHKQLRPQMRSPAPLEPILRHGIHLDREAEMVTDSLRALLLEAEGYATRIFEFVSLEHTSKNTMILAVKRDRVPARNEALSALRELKSFYGIREQCLESLLNADAMAVTSERHD